MAKLDLPCAIASEIRAALAERREDDAKRIAVEQLRAGYQSQEFWNIVAKMLEPKPKRNRGRKDEPTKDPSYWLDIGEAFLELGGSEYEGEKGEEKYEVLINLLAGKKWGPNDDSYSYAIIAKAVAFFRKARREHDAIIDAEGWGEPKHSK